MPLGRAHSLPRRAFASGLCISISLVLRDGPSALLRMRGGAPRSANLWCPSLARRRAPSGAPASAQVARSAVAQTKSATRTALGEHLPHLRRLCTAPGPAFDWSYRARAEREAKSSGSSCQGLVEWSRGEPRCRPSAWMRPKPAGAAPRPASRTPRETPLQRTRWAESNRAPRCGDKQTRIFSLPLKGGGRRANLMHRCLAREPR